MAAREGMTVIAILLFAAVANGEVIDGFEHPLDWQSHPSDSVALNIVQDPACRQRSAGFLRSDPKDGFIHFRDANSGNRGRKENGRLFG
jgi:hypothetical protein